MAPFAICTNPVCNYFVDLITDARNGEPVTVPVTPCPICRWDMTDSCGHCRQSIYYPGPDGTLAQCQNCRGNRRGRPTIPDLTGERREKRLQAAVVCLDELIVIVMERLAANSQIDVEDLASACQPHETDEDGDGEDS
jgi:hypothetical protein